MNRIMTILSPVFIIGVFRVTFGSIIPPSFLQSEARPGYAVDPVTDTTPSVRAKLIQWVLGNYHVEKVTQGDMAVITVMVLIYSALFGYLIDITLRNRAFGVSINGTMGFVGACVGLVGYARLNRPFNPEEVPVALVLMVLTSTTMLLLMAVIKGWVADGADEFMSGAREQVKAAKPKPGQLKGVAADRLAKIAGSNR